MKTKSLRINLPFMALALVCASTGFAQELTTKQEPELAKPTAAQADPRGAVEPRAIAALSTLASQPWQLSGAVEVDVEELDDQQMMMMGGPAKLAAFDGKLDIFRTKSGDCLVVSGESYPAVAILHTKSQTVVRSTAPIGEEFDAAALNADLAVILRSAELLKWAKESARWKTKTDAATGITQFTTIVPTEFDEDSPVESESDDMMGGGYSMVDPMVARALDSKLTLSVNAQDQITAIAVAVTWSDPDATMMEMAEENGEIDFELFMDADPVEGAVHYYDLKVGSGPIPKRSAATLESMRSVLK